jgi:hypothetical protein
MNEGQEVTLTWAEFYTAAAAGLLRFTISTMQNNKVRLDDFHQGAWQSILDSNIKGCVGEMAVAKYINTYWPARANTFKREADIGRWLEVRARVHTNHDLIVRDDDPPDRAYVLIVGSGPRLWVIGWIKGADAHRPEWRANHGGHEPAYFVPQAELRPMAELIDALRGDF